jgi:CheY-like chemotaxis protein
MSTCDTHHAASACRLLLVEDCAELAENITDVLELEGYQVLLMGTAEGALEALKQETFDGILTDLRLPGMSGLELIRIVRRSDRTLPIVLMTAFAAREQSEEAQRDAALSVLLKPVNPKHLLTLVAALAGKRRKLSAM